MTARFAVRMPLSLAVSIGVHLGLLLILAHTVVFPVWPTEPRGVEVELIRPPVDRLPASAGSKEEVSGRRDPAAVPSANAAPLEDTVSLESSDERYAPYLKRIKARLQAEWAYPPEAARELKEGTVAVRFTVMRTGRLSGAVVRSPSPFDILDQEALRAIQAAAPFPSFPEEMGLDRLHIDARFRYRLNSGD